jgi:hypothetical protein
VYTPTPVPNSAARFAEGAIPDARNDRVDFSKLAGFVPRWPVRKSTEQIYQDDRQHRLTREEFLSFRYHRIQTVQAFEARGVADRACAEPTEPPGGISFDTPYATARQVARVDLPGRAPSS